MIDNLFSIFVLLNLNTLKLYLQPSNSNSNSTRNQQTSRQADKMPSQKITFEQVKANMQRDAAQIKSTTSTTRYYNGHGNGNSSTTTTTKYVGGGQTISTTHFSPKK